MIQKHAVCVLVPAYNEKKKVRAVVDAVLERGFAVVVVDDGSTDGTASAVRESRAHVIVSAVNEGKGAAIRKGLDWALKNDWQAVIILDADGQHDPDELPRFLEELHLGEADVVVGNRMHDPHGMPWLRRMTNRWMSWIISGVAGQHIPDTQCGYRALTRKALEVIELRTSRFEIESEMLMEAGRKGLKIKSTPISSVYRDEASHIRPLRDTARFFRFLFSFLCSRK